jgi:hypothetical protein
MEKICRLPAVLPERREQGHEAERHLLVENLLLPHGLRGEPAVYELCEKGSSIDPVGKGDLLPERLICLVAEKFFVTDLARGPRPAAVRIGREAVRTLPGIAFMARAAASSGIG